MKNIWTWELQVVVAMWLSVILTLYLAPTAAKYLAADLMVAVLLVLALAAIGLSRTRLAAGIKPMAPLLALMAYVLVQGFVLGETGGLPYVRQLLSGFVPYVLFYVLVRNLSAGPARYILLAIFILPGLVHLAYMYWDIGVAIQKGDLSLHSTARYGFLEFVKDSPRVGRRYLSVALLHLLCGVLMLAWCFRQTAIKYWVWILSGLCVLSLVLLDARAAYVSVFLGGGALLAAVGPGRARSALQPLLPAASGWRLVLVGLVVAAVALGYSAGKSRWVAMAYSADAAVHDVFDHSAKLAERPYVDKMYWNALPDANCYLQQQFRCRADQSTYLRLAWLLTGGQSLVEHPLGIGYSADYMGRLWSVAGDTGKYQRCDSFLVKHIVSFGLPGVALYGLLVWGVLSTLRRAMRAGTASAGLVLVCGIILVCVGRSLVDVFSEGLWRYLMALLGTYYGLLHASEGRMADQAACRN